MAKTSLRLLTTSLLFLSVHLVLGIETIRLQPVAADRAEDQEEADQDESIDEIILKSYGGMKEEQETEEDRRRHGLYTDGMDLILTIEQSKALFSKRNQPGTEQWMFKRRLDNSINLWPNGIVLYNWDKLKRRHRRMMRKAFKEWEKYTCITFQKADSFTVENVIHFTTYDDGCWSELGMVRQHQELNLDSGCHYREIYLHELGHALGLLHEHQLPQRDNYISIVWEHVDPDEEIRKNLEKYSYTEVSRAHDVAYDLLSIMHYSEKAFGVDDKTTIIAHDSSKQKKMGRSKHLTFTDIKVINLFYNCSDHCLWPPTCRPDCFVNENCLCFCPEDMDTHVPSCEDYDTNCPDWAARGYCSIFRAYMLRVCRKTCIGCS